MFQYTLYIGHKDGDTEQVIDDAHDTILAIADTKFEAYTASIGEGRWQAVGEQTTILTIMGTESVRESVVELAHNLKQALNQQAVGYVESPVTVQFL